MRNVLQLPLCTYADLGPLCTVINIHEFTDVVYIKFSQPIMQLRPIEVREITDVEAETATQFTYVQGRPWLDIRSDQLNQKSGYHKYVVKFLNSTTNSLVQYYFSYILQTENPDKPYIYMNPNDPVE